MMICVCVDNLYHCAFYTRGVNDILLYKMSLVELNNEHTDKNTAHSYLPLYDELLCDKKETAKNILEVGIYSGGSIKLWHDYFVNATVYGIDILEKEFNNNIVVMRLLDILDKDNIIIFSSTDGYDETFFRENILSRNIKFDMVLDDGPHTLDSMKQFIKLYSQVLADDGILIIEDVQDWGWIESLSEIVPDELKKYIKTYDLRHIKNRWDDIVFTIDKRVAVVSTDEVL